VLGNVQLTVTNVRNPIYSASSAGRVSTSADSTPVSDPAYLTWVPGGLIATSATMPATGAAISSVDVNGLVSINYYAGALEAVTFVTTRGTFVASSTNILICADASPCDSDRSLNRIVTVLLEGDGTAGPATITATAVSPGRRTAEVVTATVPLTFASPPAVAPPVVQVTVTPTSTGVYCFTYGGASLFPADFASAFAPGVASVNVLQLPAGNYKSWFRAAPALATATGLTPGQTICVSAPPGTNVFAGG